MFRRAHKSASGTTIPLIGLLFIGLVYFSTVRPGHDWGGDFSMYIAHARNLASGKPYLDTGYLTDTEIPAEQSPPSYPPLFPLILAPVYRAFGLNYFALKMLTQSIWLVALAFIYLLARRRVPDRWTALAAVLIFGLSALVLASKESVISDGLYLAITMATLCLALWIYAENLDERRPAFAAALLVGMILAAYSTRAVGLSLALAVGAYEVFMVRRIRRFNVCFVLGVILALVLYTKLVYNASGYGGEFNFSPRMYLANALFYLGSPARLWGGCPRPIRWPLTAAFLALVTIALARRAWKPTILEFYLVASIVPVILFHDESDRYLLPVLAVLPIYAGEGFVWLVSFLEPPRRRVAIAGAGAVVLLAAGLNVAHIRTGPFIEGVEKASFQQLCQFVIHDTPADSRIIFWNPRVLALYTNHAAAWYIRTEDPVHFLRFLKRMQASYVILYGPDRESGIWLRPLIERAPENFELVYRNADFQVYRVTDYRRATDS